MKKPFRLQCIQTGALLKRYATKQEALAAQDKWPDDLIPVRVVKVKTKKTEVVSKVIRGPHLDDTTKPEVKPETKPAAKAKSDTKAFLKQRPAVAAGPEVGVFAASPNSFDEDE